MQKIIFYSTHCPKCQVLEVKLKQKNIAYEECNDIAEMSAKGIKAAPALGVIDQETSNMEILEFNNALKWINSRG